MGFLDSVGSFLSDNSGWLKPLASAGVGLYQQSAQNDARKQLADFYKKQEDDNYAAQLANRNSALAYINAVRAAGGGGHHGGGGGGGGGGGNPRAQAAAVLAAIKKRQEILRPYYESATKFRPAQESTYAQALGGLNSTFEQKLPMLLRDFGSTVPSMSIKIPGL